jgi:hypothetical protein
MRTLLTYRKKIIIMNNEIKKKIQFQEGHKRKKIIKRMRTNIDIEEN